MNKQKQTYLSPETETLVVRFEGVICTASKDGGASGGFGDQNSDVDDHSGDSWWNN